MKFLVYGIKNFKMVLEKRLHKIVTVNKMQICFISAKGIIDMLSCQGDKRQRSIVLKSVCVS